jgi:hypothetical protein
MSSTTHSAAEVTCFQAVLHRPSSGMPPGQLNIQMLLPSCARTPSISSRAGSLNRRHLMMSGGARNNRMMIRCVEHICYVGIVPTDAAFRLTRKAALKPAATMGGKLNDFLLEGREGVDASEGMRCQKSGARRRSLQTSRSWRKNPARAQP